MLFGFGAKRVLGLDIGSSSVKIAEVEERSKQLRLVRFGVYPLQPGVVAGGEIIDTVSVAGAIRGALQSMKAKAGAAASGMFGTAVVVKKITIPRMDQKAVADQIRYEAEQYIPFDINEITLDHKVLDSSLKSNSESMDVLLVAAKQEFVYRYIEVAEAAKMKLVTLDVSGFALANCFEYNYGVLPGLTVLLNIGAGATTFVVLDKGDIVFCRDIPVGGGNHTSDLMSAMNISYPEAESLKLSASMGQGGPAEVGTSLEASNAHVVDEIRNSFDFFMATAGGATISNLFVTGGSSLVPGLVQGISESVGINAQPLNPLLKMSYNSKQISAGMIEQIRPMCAVAVGLAMRKVGDK